MEIRCVWEHNGPDTLLYAENLPGAFTRGSFLEDALGKMPGEARSFLRWRGVEPPETLIAAVVQEQESTLTVRDSDSDVIFDSERLPMTEEGYQILKTLCLKSAADFLALYEAVPDKAWSCLPRRESFYGPVPRTAEEMYLHTRNVNSYYFGEIGVEADNEGDIFACRQTGFALLEAQPDCLTRPHGREL